jgi:kanamycin kinase/aminoglycoside 3'-phosphotransferase-2
MNADREMLPAEIRELIWDSRFTFKYENIAKTFLIQGKNSVNKYLKIQKIGSTETIEEQAKRLMWLQNRLPVPNVMGYGVTGDYEYLLTSELPGFEASNEILRTNPDQIIRLLANGLRRIHDISIEDCPFDNSIGQLMKVIRYNFQQGIIDSIDLNKKFGISNLETLLHEVEMYSKDLTEDLVFTHGDYSVPNIIINGREISGFIDMGNCGIADRYYDLAVAVKSIIRNFGSDYTEMFFDEYGSMEIDQEKIKFYQIVEHLAWV